MQRSASRSQGSKTHPCAKFVRFTEKENQRLNRLCRKRKLTVQTFAHAAIMRALGEAELGKKTEIEQYNDGEIDREPSYEPRGFGLRDQLRSNRDDDDEPRERRREEPERPLISPTTAPTLTRVMTTDEVALLARTVVEAPASTRREVMQAAVRTLARGRSQEEGLRLAEELDAEIKRLGGGDVPKTALERVRARMAK